jgi:hypothetical protein
MPHKRALRTRQVRNPYELLAAAIVLWAREEWLCLQRNGHGGPPWPLAAEREELEEFFRSPWCEALCQWSGVDYHVLLAQTVDAPPPPKPPKPRALSQALAILQQGPTTVRELEKALGCPHRTAHYILTYAYQQGLVRRERGRWKGYIYTLAEGEASTTPAE